MAEQFLDKENQHALGEYATFDLGGTLNFGHSRLNIRVANLFDREYSDTGFIGAFGEERLVPAAGRNVVASLSVH